jgi:hypothetical protein
MSFLILDGPPNPRPGRNSVYRGTYRAHPSHCDELPDDHEINKLFFWFLKEGGEAGVVRDVSKALRFAELWNARRQEKERFEVAEVTDGNVRPQSNGEFIGFDISCGYNNSLLSSGLKPFTGVNRLPDPVRELCDLMSRHYAPQLNGQGLFQTFEIASLCRRTMIALQDLSPNLFEGGNLRDFQVVGLHVVDSRGGLGGNAD